MKLLSAIPINRANMRKASAALAMISALIITETTQAALKDGMVAYWPFNEVTGTKTPDLVNGYDMELVNLTASDLVDGKKGKAFKFENARQTMLKRINSAGELLPINQYPAFTISFWANVTGTGLTDLRLFSEANTSDNNPLFNLGTANTGASGQLDFYIRQTGWTTVDHLKSDGEPLDGTWRHIAFVQQQDGIRSLYVDGVKDTVEIPAKTDGAWRVNTTTIGGILRANPTHWLTGILDEFALWNRALSEDELTTLVRDGTPIPPPKLQPLAIRSFTVDLPAVAVGDSVWMRWDVTKDVQVIIDQGVGDVTAKTVAGLGEIQVPLTGSKTFTLTLKRDTEALTASVSVAAIDGISSGWSLIENFDRYSAGLLNGQGGWKDLDSAEFTVMNINGNHMVGANTGGATAVLRLGPQALNEGQQASLFFRVYQLGDQIEVAKATVALSDRNVRFGGDVGGAGNDIGPGAVISSEGGTGLQVGGANGNGSPVDFFEPFLTFKTVYNVWVDIKNGPFPADQSSTGDTYTIHVAKDGVSQRTTLFSDYISARGQGAADVGFATKNLDKLIIGGLTGTSTTTNLFIDDIYLSKSGFNSSVPRAFGFTTPKISEPPTLSISYAASQVSITYTGGTLESADIITGTWAPVANASSPYKIAPLGGQKFYRIKQ